jgi:hypothetical protein
MQEGLEVDRYWADRKHNFLISNLMSNVSERR